MISVVVTPVNQSHSFNIPFFTENVLIYLKKKNYLNFFLLKFFFSEIFFYLLHFLKICFD